MSEKEEGTPVADLLSDVAGKIDVKLEEEGEWFSHPPEAAESVAPNEIDHFRSLLIDENGTGLHRVKVCSRHLSQGYQDEIKALSTRTFRMSEKRKAKVLAETEPKILWRHCLVDWDFTNRNGEPIPCTEEFKLAVMVESKAFRHHRNFITAALLTHEGAIARTLEADEGN